VIAIKSANSGVQRTVIKTFSQNVLFPYRGWSKSRVIYSWRMFYLLKNKPNWNQTAKTMLYQVLGTPTAFSAACVHSFPCLMQPAVPHKPFTTQDTVGLFGTGQQVNVPVNSLLQVKQERDARQRSAVDSRCMVKKTSFCLHRLKTADGLAPAGYSTTWPVWAVVQSQRHCVCINAA
jgi:hypothetical protein